MTLASTKETPKAPALLQKAPLIANAPYTSEMLVGSTALERVMGIVEFATRPRVASCLTAEVLECDPGSIRETVGSINTQGHQVMLSRGACARSILRIVTCLSWRQGASSDVDATNWAMDTILG